MRKISIVDCDYMYSDACMIGEDGREYGVAETLRYIHPQSVGLADMEVRRYRVEGGRDPALAPYEGVAKDFSKKVCAAVRQGNPVITTGGFCNYAPAVLGGLQRALGTEKKIGVVWLDAHSDNRILGQEERPLRYVSIPLSTICGQGMEYYRREVCGLEIPVTGREILASDLRMMDEVSWRNLETAGIRHLDGGAFADERIWQEAVEELAEQVDAIYMSIDADILKPEYVPGYIKVVPGGQELSVVCHGVSAVAATGKLAVCSFFCFNFDKEGQAAEITHRSQMEIIDALLKCWK